MNIRVTVDAVKGLIELFLRYVNIKYSNFNVNIARLEALHYSALVREIVFPLSDTKDRKLGINAPALQLFNFYLEICQDLICNFLAAKSSHSD